MENQQFDALVKEMTQTRLSRLATLRGLAVGALTGLAGAGLLSADAEGKQRNKGKGKDKSKGKGKGKGKAHKNKTGQDDAKGEHWGWPQGSGKRVEICHCPACHTLNLPEKAAQLHLKQHPTDRVGSCAAQTTTTTTTAAPTTTTAAPTTTTTTTTTTVPPCIPDHGACNGSSTCCTDRYICGDQGTCCGDWQAPCRTTSDCCPCYENGINRCICNTAGGYCIMTEIG